MRSREERLADVRRFYDLLKHLEQRLGARRPLGASFDPGQCPEWGVCFFFEPGEMRTSSGWGPRVVRVGPEALTPRGDIWLSDGLRQHRGTLDGPYRGGGDHRSSLFRLLVGTALMAKYQVSGPVVETWGRGVSAAPEAREREHPLELGVSEHIRSISCLWVAVDEAPGPDTLGDYIKRNAIALLSNYEAPYQPIDPAGENWLGRWAADEAVRESGLWNVQHVAEPYDPAFLRALQVTVTERVPVAVA